MYKDEDQGKIKEEADENQLLGVHSPIEFDKIDEDKKEILDCQKNLLKVMFLENNQFVDEEKKKHFSNQVKCMVCEVSFAKEDLLCPERDPFLVLLCQNEDCKTIQFGHKLCLLESIQGNKTIFFRRVF